MTEQARLLPMPLPVPRTSFVGRSREIEDLRNVLTRSRLLTLIGVAGCGKTRLALQVATSAMADFDDGVAFVELAPVRELVGIREATAAALGLPQRNVSSITRAIGSARLLVVIDNAEHVLDAVSEVAEEILSRCANTSVVVTSRELLNVDGETRWRVEPLELPRSEAVTDLQAMQSQDAVRLFCERAREHLPAFQLVDANASQVATICRRLEGIPLALELAAARVRALALNDIAARLDDLLGLLSHGRRTALPRHRTMLSAIDWSYELLSPDERLLLPRLSIFANTFDLQAVEAICSDGSVPKKAIADLLRQLVDKCLVVTSPRADGTLHYWLMEVLRQYGLRQLPSQDRAIIADRHSKFYADLVHQHTTSDMPPSARSQMISVNYNNVQLALDRLIDSDPVNALPMVEDLQWWWLLRGSVSEARRRIERLLADERIDDHKLVRLCASGHTWSFMAGDHEAAATYAERAIALAGDDADTALQLWIVNMLGLTAAQHDDWQSAERHFRRAIELCELAAPDAFANRADLWGNGLSPTRSRMLSMSRNNLAHLLLVTGRHQEARVESENALAALSDVEVPTIAPWLLATQGQVLLTLGQPMRARDQFTEALEQVAAHGADSLAVELLTGLACVAADCGEFAASLTLSAAGQSAERRSGIDTSLPREHPEHVPSMTEAVKRSRTELTERAAAAAWNRGTSMTLVDALSFVRSLRRQPPGRAPLTRRQMEIARLVGLGLSDKQIAGELHISRRTVEAHLAQVRRQLALQNRAQIAVWSVSADGAVSTTRAAPADPQTCDAR